MHEYDYIAPKLRSFFKMVEEKEENGKGTWKKNDEIYETSYRWN
jgi:hypothetical protein